MGIIDNIRRWLKGIGDAPYSDDSHWPPVFGGRATRILLPGSDIDWRRKAGSPWLNSAAWIGINWIAQSFPEAPISVVRDGPDGDIWDADHPLCQLWNKPNTAYSGSALASGVVLSLLCDGNAYLQKVRGRAGGLAAPVELYWLPHWRIEPVADRGSNRLVDRYEMAMPDGSKQRYAVEDMIHLRYGLDPENTRKGMAPLKPILREIASDNEATTFVAAILGNMGIPGVVISTRDPSTDIPEDEAERLKELFRRRTTGDERGRPVVIPAPIQLDTIGMSPNDLALTDLIDQSISRILASMGLSAMAVGLPDTQRTYSNYGQALASAWDNAVTPLMAMVAQGVEHQLLPEYGPPNRLRVAFDLSDVKALQEDWLQRDTRARQNYVSGIWKRAEARAATGMAVEPEDDVYVDEVRAAQQMAALDRQAQISAQTPAPPQPDNSVKQLEPEEPSPWVERIMREIAELEQERDG